MKKKTEKRPQTKISMLLQLFMAVMFLTGAAVFTYPFLADALRIIWTKEGSRIIKNSLHERKKKNMSND